MEDITPDLLYRFPSPESKTFIYTSDGNLFVTHGSKSHIDLAMDSGIFHDTKKRTKILGRVSKYNGKDVVSFWWETGQKALMKPCLEKLLQDRVVGPSTIVAIKGVNPSTVEEFIKNQDPYNVDEFGSKQAQAIHLLRGDEKKKALLAMGALPKVRKSPLNVIGDHALNFFDWINTQKN